MIFYGQSPISEYVLRSFLYAGFTVRLTAYDQLCVIQPILVSLTILFSHRRLLGVQSDASPWILDHVGFPPSAAAVRLYLRVRTSVSSIHSDHHSHYILLH